MTLGEKLASMGIELEAIDNERCTIRHSTDAMAVVGAAAAMVQGACAEKFVWLSGGVLGQKGGWATLKIVS